MPLGYLGYLTIANTNLLCNSTGLNRQINPLMSQAVWGAGWYNAAATTNYADSQQHFEGGMTFELQGIAAVWNLIRTWLIEQRVFSQKAIISPNGIISYTYDPAGDARGGIWLSQCSFNIDATALIGVSATGIALKRTEASTGSSYTAINDQGRRPVAPLNPAPYNRNPIPGWNTAASITWPSIGAGAFWTPTNLNGLVLMNATVNVNNNTQIIRGCTGDANPVAVLQGTIGVDGNITVWRDGEIKDPYAQSGSPFTASAASVDLTLGGVFGMHLAHVLLTSDAYDIQAPNSPTTRNFGIAGLGDGTAPPFKMDLAS